MCPCTVNTEPCGLLGAVGTENYRAGRCMYGRGRATVPAESDRWPLRLLGTAVPIYGRDSDRRASALRLYSALEL
eukprot:3792088-Prymnesium_polylepis.1